MGDWEQKKHLINELAEGRELAKQLQSHLNLPSSPNENEEVLVQKIIATFEKALSMLKCSVGTSSTPGAAAIGFSESPPSLNGSPRSDQDSDPEHRSAGLGKRKNMPKWTKQVKVSPEMGIESPLEDGFSWRKYGQKDILGAKHPRAYYRCTHRPVRGCLATKQVQRSDEDPTILEFTYRGRHTCKQSTINSSTHSPPPPPPQQNQSEEQLLLMNYLCPENHFFRVQNNLAEDFAPSFLSPATSGTSYFSMSPNGLHTSLQNFQSSEADQFSEIFSSSAATSGTNSPTFDLDFQFGIANQFDTHFTFDHPGSLS